MNALNNNNLRNWIYVGLELLFAVLLVVAIVQAFVSGVVEPVEKLLNLAALLGFDLARRFVPAVGSDRSHTTTTVD